jgi:hypothetical protein
MSQFTVALPFDSAIGTEEQTSDVHDNRAETSVMEVVLLLLALTQPVD